MYKEDVSVRLYESDQVKVPVSENSEEKSDHFTHSLRKTAVEKYEELSDLIRENNSEGNNWDDIYKLLNSETLHSMFYCDQLSQVSYNNTFLTFLLCDEKFKSTFQLIPLSNSTLSSLANSEQIEINKQLYHKSNKSKNDKINFHSTDNSCPFIDIDIPNYYQFTDYSKFTDNVKI